MTSLRKRYKELRLREYEIKKELHEADRMPKLEVLHWLDAVDDVKKQVKQLKNPRAYKVLSCFSDLRKMSKEIKQLLRCSQFPNGVYPKMRILVEQCPSRSQLFGTIWVNLMDPNVRITGIYGDCGVGKTTAMRSVSDKLATSEMFDAIFWITVSKISDTLRETVYDLQTDLAEQMKLFLPEFGRASVLFEYLNRCHSFVIIIDGLCEGVSLTEVGIPEPSNENRSKIVLISQDFNVCVASNSDKIIKVDVISSTEKWNLFARKAGDTILAPDIKSLAKQLVELCPGRPVLIDAISYAMRDEVSIQVWRNTLAHLVGFNIVFNLLKICYERLKDDMVQKCFLHFALSPINCTFKPEELIRYWIHVNIIHEGADDEAKVSTGIIIMRKLLDAKMMEMTERSGDACLKMTDMWKRWATTIMEKEPELCLNPIQVREDIFAFKFNNNEVKQNTEISTVAEDMFAFKSVIQTPKRPQLLDTIWDNLMDPQVRIMSIYGEWGVGKTTAMMKIKKPLAGISDGFDSIIWVTFSKVSGLYQLQTDIALQINLILPEIGRAAKLLKGLQKIEKFLIIIDDVSDIIPFVKVGIPVPSGDNRYKIALISRDIQVCNLMKSDKIIKLDTFSFTEKWDVFVSKAGNMVINPDIQSLARRLVELCPGRPLIINAISHSMRDEVSIQVWRNTVEYLMGFETEDMAFELLRICYKCLKDDTVQKCFLYCSLFPEDYHFDPEELIRYWMAEGFIYVDADIMTRRDNGFKIMTKLLDASMLEMSAKGEDDWLKMPYLCRVLAVRILKEETDFDVYAGLGLEKMPYNSGMGVEGKVSLMRNQIEVLEVLPFSFNNASTVLFHENPISHIHPSFFTPMLTLQFLDLSYTWITELPSTVSELTQLRALFLQYCSNLEIMPSLQKLTKLQFLSLSGTSIAELPDGMEGLVSLRSLDLTDTQKLWHIGVGTISALSHLEELRLHGSGLCKFDSPMVTNSLMEMRCLKDLAILTISTSCYGDVLETVMCLQEHKLRVFSIKAYGSTEDCDEDI